MVYLEKKEVNDAFVKYYYFTIRGTEKGVLVYYPNTDTRIVEKYCEGDTEESYMSKHRGHAFRRIKEYASKNNYPERDIVAWG